jgi:hypothetical protein
MKRLRASIRNIRRADDSVKRRFYYGGAVFFMALVIGGWFIFVQIYPPLPRANENVEEESIKEEKTSSANTFALGFQTIQENMARLWGENQKALENQFGNVGDELSKTRDIVIQAPEENFYFENGESFPTTTLPSAPEKQGN